MNDTAVKNFCIQARVDLMQEVRQKLIWWGISEEGIEPVSGDGVLLGRPLSSQEIRQRETLVVECSANGYEALVERGAYTWFNRLVAVRFMELNDRLPCRCRMLSADDGSFHPECLKNPLDLEIGDIIDPARVLEFVQAADDEGLFKYLFLAQCAELHTCMPDVFDAVGGAWELLFPDGLLKPGSVLERLVGEISEDDWREGVEIVGWMYQYYMTDVRAFLQDKKAGSGQIGTATQLYTPDWIVRFLVENSLGRLWMLNHPESRLKDRMAYYIEAEASNRETKYKTVPSPEDMTISDPACGSSHILVYAFDLLMQMYLESGFTQRDAVRSIVEKNLFGFEIDPRASQLASFAISMKACEYDGRFLRREIAPHVMLLT